MSTSLTTQAPIEPRPVSNTKQSKLLKVEGEEYTKKQKLFVEKYIQNKGHIYKSAVEAGYSESTARNAHSTILRSRWVQKELRRRCTEWFENEERNSDWILEQAGIKAGTNIFDFGYVDDSGNFQINLSQCTREMAYGIQELSYDVNGRPKIRLVDGKAYLELYAKLRGMFNDDPKDKKGAAGQPLTVESFDEILRQAKSVTINNQYNIVSQERQQLPETIEAQ